MSRIDFRVDRHFYTTGYLGRRAWSVFGPESDRRPVSRECGRIAPVCDRWQPSATGSTPTTQSVKEYPAELKDSDVVFFLPAVYLDWDNM